MEIVQPKAKSSAVIYCEEHYPETMRKFREIQQEQIELFASKQMDYGPHNIYMNGDKQLSLEGLCFRMNDKIQRLFHLNKTKQEAQNEPAIDAFKDVSIYGIIAQIVDADCWAK